ncbi:MAG: phosphate-starvation-inducible PsiE family protein [Pseudanabaenaceae cyanobacterium bins.68]|nr:phosphate-starvation-inducible PsiE family protein [Pseudanabaenaceae cyanobacterium bins.68]
MAKFHRLARRLSQNTLFLAAIDWVVQIVVKVLALVMVFVTLIAVLDLIFTLVKDLLNTTKPFFSTELLKIFGLFLNVLIAIEILENITAYLKKHTIQLELVIATSLTAVARKLVIFDSKVGGSDLTGLALAILALSISYWIIHGINQVKHE